MAGGLTISTLNDSSGVLATQNGMSGIAKAWVNFVGSTGSINSSFNVSSVTRNSTGDYTINFTTAMPSANYSIANAQGYNTGVMESTFTVVNTSTVPTTTAYRIKTYNASQTIFDSPYVSSSVFR